MMAEKRMGEMKGLSSFATTGKAIGKGDVTPAVVQQPEPEENVRSPEEVIEESPPIISTPKRTKAAKPKVAERMVTINIKIPQSQQDWLADTARDVRANNDEPVPSSDRVYPQHLVQAAVDLLKASNVNWAEVRNIKDLRDQLSL